MDRQTDGRTGRHFIISFVWMSGIKGKGTPKCWGGPGPDPFRFLRLPVLYVKPAVTFPATEHHRGTLWLISNYTAWRQRQRDGRNLWKFSCSKTSTEINRGSTAEQLTEENLMSLPRRNEKNGPNWESNSQYAQHSMTPHHIGLPSLTHDYSMVSFSFFNLIILCC